MLLELHIVQNFAPSNLNRDDTGSPKSCDFGGYRRARISSQCIKRAIRHEFEVGGLVPDDRRAQRSKRFVEAIKEKLVTAGRPAEQSAGVAEAGLGLLDIKLADEQKTQYLLYMSPMEIEAIARFCDEQWDALAAAAATTRGAKKGAKEGDAAGLAKRLKETLDGGKACDLALFGRMLADLPDKNIDAASQVAHAISTHQVAAEFDYYTAVDDRKPEDTAGADMIGTVEFNSACYYRYANIDLGQLKKNLANDGELAEATVQAFLLASRDAVPTGKQNSFAARNAPSMFFSVVRESGAWSLANAFARPIALHEIREAGGIAAASIEALDKHWGELVGLYGPLPSASLAVCAMGSPDLHNLSGSQVTTFAEFAQKTVAAARASLEV